MNKYGLASPWRDMYFRFDALISTVAFLPSFLFAQLTELNLMTYDFHGSWNDETGVNSPLYDQEGSPSFSVHGERRRFSAAGRWFIVSLFALRFILLFHPRLRCKLVRKGSRERKDEHWVCEYFSFMSRSASRVINTVLILTNAFARSRFTGDRLRKQRICINATRAMTGFGSKTRVCLSVSQ